MSTPAGALAPTTIPGEVMTPAAVVGPLAFPAHDFLTTVKTLIHRSGAFHSEDDLKSALASVDNYERVMLKNDHQHVVSEGDAAPHEDVTLREAPRVGSVPVPSNAPQIDYSRLAQALMAAGFGQAPPANQEGNQE